VQAPDSSFHDTTRSHWSSLRFACIKFSSHIQAHIATPGPGPNIRMGGLFSPTQSRLGAAAGGPTNSSRALTSKFRQFFHRVGYTIAFNLAVIFGGRRGLECIPRRQVFSYRGKFTAWASRWRVRWAFCPVSRQSLGGGTPTLRLGGRPVEVALAASDDPIREPALHFSHSMKSRSALSLQSCRHSRAALRAGRQDRRSHPKPP
jgi:hypothetical protein